MTHKQPTWRELRKIHYSRLESLSPQHRSDCVQVGEGQSIDESLGKHGQGTHEPSLTSSGDTQDYRPDPRLVTDTPLTETRFPRLRLIYLMAREAFCHVRY